MSAATEAAPITLPGRAFAYTLEELVDATPFSTSTFRRAIAKPKADGAFPHPLTAHRDSKGRVIVLATDAQAWLEALPDY